MSAAEKPEIDAKVAGESLVVSFLCGADSLVWRAAMARLTDAVFELKPAAEESVVLCLRTGDMVEEIYTFPNKTYAVAGLRAVTQALLSPAAASLAPAHVHAGYVAVPPPVKKTGLAGKFFKFLFWLFIAFIVLVFTVVFIFPSKVNVGAVVTGTGDPIPASKVFGE